MLSWSTHLSGGFSGAIRLPLQMVILSYWNKVELGLSLFFRKTSIEDWTESGKQFCAARSLIGASKADGGETKRLDTEHEVDQIPELKQRVICSRKNESEITLDGRGHQVILQILVYQRVGCKRLLLHLCRVWFRSQLQSWIPQASAAQWTLEQRTDAEKPFPRKR